MPHTQHALRPEFTETLARRLVQGESINLISPHGQGRRRTLQDLHSLLPKDYAVKQIDLRADEATWKRWLSDFPENCKVKLLILHNFDLLTDQAIANKLNIIMNQKVVTLLTVSEATRPNRLPNIKNEMLPSVTARQLQMEMCRRNLPVDTSEHIELANWLLTQTEPYSLLDTLNDDWFEQRPWSA